LNYGKTWKDRLTLVGKEAETDSSTLHFKIDLNEIKLTDSYISDSTRISQSLAYLKNGDIVECFKRNLIRRTNFAGETLWEKSIPISNSTIRNMTVDAESNVYICGHQRIEGEFGPTDNAIIYAVSKHGETLWQKVIPPEAKPGPYTWSAYRYLYDIETTQDGGLVATGEVGYSYEAPFTDVYVCKYNTEGDTIWNMTYHVGNTKNYGAQLITDEDNIVIIGAARISDIASSQKGFTLKIKDLSYIVKDTMMDTMTYINSSLATEKELKFYPNPGKYYVHIDYDLPTYQNFTIQILNEQGQLLTESRNKKLIPVYHLNTGKYIVRLKTNQFTFSTKWMKLE